ncbi:MAG: helix-turn-helix transcriptional regulator [Oscillospiraceae bacterium]|nr:helix-turn-helix transcriptional regulator [Oscillospiraceae bacterium]
MANMTLRGVIVSKYGSLDAFGKDVGWSHRKVSYIVNGKQEPTASEIELMADKLEIEVSDLFRQIFFGACSQTVNMEA